MVRVWRDAHPALLSPKHLLAEHREIHSIYTAVGNARRAQARAHLNPDGQPERTGYANHSETQRFMPDGARWLVFRHALLQAELERRFGERHSHGQHRTPLEWQSARPTSQHERYELDSQVGEFNRALGLYIDEQNAEAWRGVGRAQMEIVEIDAWFYEFMAEYARGFPATALDDGCDTPWERNGVTMTSESGGRGSWYG